MSKRATIVIKWFAACVIGIAIISGVGYVAAHQKDALRQLTLATTHQPEPFTELYFAESDALPASITTSSAALPVTFVIHNLEAKTVPYTYRVLFTDASGTTLASADGTVTLKDDQSQSITQTIALPAGQARGAVIVQLIGKSQQIHYWLGRA